MEINGKDAYFLAVKALICNKDKLLITHDIFDCYDIPGGRIKKEEFNKPLQEVLMRKIKEELGEKIKYEIAENPSIFFTVERKERLETGEEMPVRIFGLGFIVNYINGEVELGKHHNRYEWVDIDTYEPEKYFVGGWEKGIREFITKKLR